MRGAAIVPGVSGTLFRSLARARPPGRRLGYGAVAGIRAPVRRLADNIAGLIEEHPPEEIPRRVTEALRKVLTEPELLGPRHQQADSVSYCRHLLYADPLGRFSILSLVWGSGQGTPVHGHTAWGCLGVYRGLLTITEYDFAAREADAFRCCEARRVLARPGDAGCVRPGIEDLHRVANLASDPAISIHVYGKDLLYDPASLNIVLSA